LEAVGATKRVVEVAEIAESTLLRLSLRIRQKIELV